MGNENYWLIYEKSLNNQFDLRELVQYLETRNILITQRDGSIIQFDIQNLINKKVSLEQLINEINSGQDIAFDWRFPFNDVYISSTFSWLRSGLISQYYHLSELKDQNIDIVIPAFIEWFKILCQKERGIALIMNVAYYTSAFFSIDDWDDFFLGKKEWEDWPLILGLNNETAQLVQEELDVYGNNQVKFAHGIFCFMQEGEKYF
jgi:hypothetical protein